MSVKQSIDKGLEKKQQQIKQEETDMSENEVFWHSVGEYLTEQVESVESSLVCTDNDGELFVTVWVDERSKIPHGIGLIAGLKHLNMHTHGTKQVELRK